MKAMLSKTWEEYIKPLFRRPSRLQVAALCLRGADTAREVLMITSRDTGRWIIPKGWPMNGKTCAEAALQEAWEEAGVKKARIKDTPIGSYSYAKRRDNGTEEPVTTLIYAADVDELALTYPEAHQRTRQWMSPKAAAELVQEPELQALLRSL